MDEALELMIDLETLATTAKSVVLSIGILPFDDKGPRMDMGRTYYPSFCQQTDDRGGERPREISLGTLQFWAMQSGEAAAGVFVPESQRLLVHQVAADLHDYVTQKVRPTSVWANGDLFDLGILDDLFGWGDDRPWKYDAPSDLRTLMKELYPLGWMRPEPKADHVQHDALYDCRYQVECLLSARQFIRTMQMGANPLAIKGLSLNVADDGTWLAFDGGSRKASLNTELLAEKQGSIICAAILGWANARRDEAGKPHVMDVTA
jgi:hypothetical protein